MAEGEWYGAASTPTPLPVMVTFMPKVEPKRKWGDAAAAVYSDHETRMWTWECRVDDCPVVAPQEAVAWHGTQGEALSALAEHQKAEHVDALFRGDRGGPLGMAMDRTSERVGA